MSSLDSKVIAANNLIDSGMSPEAAADAAGITGDDLLNVSVDETIGGTGKISALPDIPAVTPSTVSYQEINATTSGGGWTETTRGETTDTPKSLSLQAEADRLTAAADARGAIIKAQVLADNPDASNAEIFQAKVADPSWNAYKLQSTQVSAKADRNRITAPSTTTRYAPNGSVVTDEEFNSLTPEEQADVTATEEHIVSSDTGATDSDNIAPEDDPAYQATEIATAPSATDSDFLTSVSGTGDVDIGFNPLTPEQQEKAAREELAKRVAEGQQLASELNDWRVRLHLAPDANYLYKAEYPGILKPLVATNGIIFPYTPTIAIQYAADYENYDLVHSNYRGYFYKGSQVQNILFTATFTANSVQEADYMLAAMHFLKSATKMFYGQDTQRGMPPPVVFLTGLGEYQFNNHPCVLTMVNYNLPNDVDYIPCGKPAGVDTNLTVPVKSNDKEALKEARLRASGIGPGGRPIPLSQLDQGPVQADISTYTKATYMPTKLEITFTMVPIQTRDQVSNEFSLEEYATGFLLKKGFW